MKKWGKNGRFSMTLKVIFKFVKMTILLRKIPKSRASLQGTVVSKSKKIMKVSSQDAYSRKDVY